MFTNVKDSKICFCKSIIRLLKASGYTSSVTSVVSVFKKMLNNISQRQYTPSYTTMIL